MQKAARPIITEGLCRCFRRDQHLVGGGLKTGSNGPFVTKCGQCRSQRDKPFSPIHSAATKRTPTLTA